MGRILAVVLLWCVLMPGVSWAVWDADGWEFWLYESNSCSEGSSSGNWEIRQFEYQAGSGDTNDAVFAAGKAWVNGLSAGWCDGTCASLEYVPNTYCKVMKCAGNYGRMCGESGNYHYRQAYFITSAYPPYGNPNVCPTRWEYLNKDDDNDGIPNRADPYPTDPSTFKWQKVQEVRNSSGVLKALLIRTDRGDSYWAGDQDFAERCIADEVECQMKGFVYVGDKYPEDGQDLVAYFGSGVLVPGGGFAGSSTVENGERSVEHTTGMSSGVQANGDTDGTSLQQKIVDNTGKIVDNVGLVGDRVKAVEQEVRDLRNNLGSGGGSGGGSGLTTGDVSSGVAAGLAAHDAAVDEATAAEQGALNGYNPNGQAWSNEQGYRAEDFVEAAPENGLTGLLDDFLALSPLASVVSGTYLQPSSPQCCFNATVDIMGHEHSIQFDLCPYEGYLDYLGNYVFLYFGLVSVLVFFRGR